MSAYQLVFNITEAVRFLALLALLDQKPDPQFAFRTFHDKGDDPRLAVKCYGTLYNGVRQSSNPVKNGKACKPLALLRYMQSLGAGVFVVPNETDGHGQLKKNVTGIRVFYVDADTADQVARVLAFIAASGLEPTVIVASGGIHNGVEKLQIYWRVDGCPVEEFTAGQLMLISRVGTDPAVQDAGRVMRLPGGCHLKKDEPRPTRIISATAIKYDCSDFLRRVENQPQFCDPWARHRGATAGTRRPSMAHQVIAGSPTARLRTLLDRHGGLVTPSVHALLREAMSPTDGAGGNRHSTLLAITARCVQTRWADTDIRALVLPVVNTEWGDGDWSDHVDRMLGWTRRQEAAALAAEPAASPAMRRAFGAHQEGAR